MTTDTPDDPSPGPPEQLLKLQRRFASHLRDPDSFAPVDGIEERRLAIYRRLFFNNVSNLMARNFPVLRRLHSDAEWNALIRGFMQRHHASTPLFPQIGQEMVAFLQHEQERGSLGKPFFVELAHWEFLETCVRLDADDPRDIEATPGRSPAEGRPVLNPTLRLAAYQWPVHQIGPDWLPESRPDRPTILMVYRKRSDKVAFTAVNALTARLIQLLQEHPTATGLELLERIASERPALDPETVKARGLDLIAGLVDSEVILATHNP
jgi:hypothetical protein